MNAIKTKSGKWCAVLVRNGERSIGRPRFVNDYGCDLLEIYNPAYADEHFRNEHMDMRFGAFVADVDIDTFKRLRCAWDMYGGQCVMSADDVSNLQRVI